MTLVNTTTFYIQVYKRTFTSEHLLLIFGLNYQIPSGEIFLRGFSFVSQFIFVKFRVNLISRIAYKWIFRESYFYQEYE